MTETASVTTGKPAGKLGGCGTMLVMALLVFFAFVFGFGAWRQYGKATAFAERGVRAKGTVAKAWTTRERRGKRGGSRTVYHKLVTFVDAEGRAREFKTTHGPDHWNAGQKVPVVYLPEDSTQAGIEGSADTSFVPVWIMAGFAFGALVAAMCLLWRQLKRWFPDLAPMDAGDNPP